MNLANLKIKNLIFTHKKELFMSFFLSNIIVFFIVLFFKNLSLALFLSYELSFFSSFCIIFSSYLHYKKIIIFQSSLLKIKPLHITQVKIQTFPKILKFYDLKYEFKSGFKSFIWFFSLGKILSYMLLAFVFVLLQSFHLLHIFAFFAGIFALLLALFIFILWLRK